MSNGKTRSAHDYRYGGSKFTAHELYAESVCAHCGKVFMRTSEHVYKRIEGRLKYYCSYNCFRVKQREEERLAREEYERECERLRTKEEWESKATRAKELCRGETVVIHSKADAEVKLEESERQIERHMNTMLKCALGTHERRCARRNLTRWKRKAAYIRNFLAALEKTEQEE